MKKASYKANDWYQLIAFCILGFVSGLPFALVTTTFQAWLASSQVSVGAIGLLGLVSLPYALKPLWAIGIDWLCATTSFSSRIIYLAAVLLLSGSLYGMSTFHDHTHSGLIILVVMGCFASATIDICVDAIRIISIDKSMQGTVSAWFVIFYRIAFIISGGMALVIVEQIGWQGLYQAMAVLMLVVGVLGYVMSLGLRISQGLPDAGTMSFFSTISTWIKSHYTQVVSALSFIFAYKFHGVFLSSLLQVYLINEANMSLAFMGYTYKTGGMLATFLGGVIGGYLSRQASVKRGVQVTILIQLIATSMFIGIQTLPVASAAHLGLITLAMYMESLSIGTSTTMITIIITKNCQKHLAATQYAFFTAVIAWQRSLIAPLAALVQEYCGWQGYFLCSLAFIPIILSLLETDKHTLALADRAGASG